MHPAFNLTKLTLEFLKSYFNYEIDENLDENFIVSIKLDCFQVQLKFALKNVLVTVIATQFNANNEN